MTLLPDVLSIGDLDVDFYIEVPAIPGFDQKLAGRSLGQKPGGMAANFAVALTRLGRPTRLLAAVGDDAAGRQVLAQLGAEGLDLSAVAEKKGADTFMCVVLLSPSGEKSLIKLESEAYLPRLDDLRPEAFEGIRHVHATYGSPELTAKAFEMAQARGISTSLDLEPPDIRQAPQLLSRILPLVDTLFLNKEAHALASGLRAGEFNPDVLKAGGEIVVTLGAHGCRRIAADATLDSPGFKVRPIDTTGAGDCFAAAFLSRKLEGDPPSACLAFGNAAAALATLDFGSQTAMPNRDAVEAFLRATTPLQTTGQLHA